MPRLQAPVHASLEHDLIRQYTGPWTWTLEFQTNLREDFTVTIQEEGLLLVENTYKCLLAFIFKSLLKHYANWAPKHGKSLMALVPSRGHLRDCSFEALMAILHQTGNGNGTLTDGHLFSWLQLKLVADITGTLMAE